MTNPFSQIGQHAQWDDIVASINQTASSYSIEHTFVGVSGGVDSMVLLERTVAALGGENVTALCVNHGLSENASQWTQHVKQFTETLNCGFQPLDGNVINEGKGVEAAARELRFKLFKETIPAGGLLMLGHHLDDQVETYFLRLFRGAGPNALTGMSEISKRDHYSIFRPLLSISRSEIEAFARANSIEWITDESNSDVKFDRNFLRNEVLPLIETRWPKYRDRVQHVMALESNQTLAASQEGGQKNLKLEREHRLSHDGGLKMVQLADWSDPDLLSLIHAWLTGLGVQVPSANRLKNVLNEVYRAKPGAQPKVEVSGGFVHRHGPALYWVAKQETPGEAPSAEVGNWVNWKNLGDVRLSKAIASASEPALRSDLPDLRWSLRAGGEEMRPYGRTKRRDLKRLFQEYRIAPWLRDRTPLLFSGDELVAVAGHFVSDEHRVEEGSEGIVVEFRFQSQF